MVRNSYFLRWMNIMFEVRNQTIAYIYYVMFLPTKSGHFFLEKSKTYFHRRLLMEYGFFAKAPLWKPTW